MPALAVRVKANNLASLGRECAVTKSEVEENKTNTALTMKKSTGAAGEAART